MWWVVGLGGAAVAVLLVAMMITSWTGGSRPSRSRAPASADGGSPAGSGSPAGLPTTPPATSSPVAPRSTTPPSRHPVHGQLWTKPPRNVAEFFAEDIEIQVANGNARCLHEVIDLEIMAQNVVARMGIPQRSRQEYARGFLDSARMSLQIAQAMRPSWLEAGPTSCFASRIAAGR